jgi:hypothetical protein
MFNKKRSFADITFNSLSGVEGQFIRKSAEMVSFLKYVISACDFIFASVVWWDTDALTFLYPLKGVCAATMISIVGLIANLMSPEKLSGSFSHTGSLSDFKTKMNLATSKSNKITAEAKFKSEGGMSAEIKIKTPFTDYHGLFSIRYGDSRFHLSFIFI